MPAFDLTISSTPFPIARAAPCDYATLEQRHDDAMRTGGECVICGQECAFFQIILQAKDIISSAEIAETSYPDRFSDPPAGVDAAGASIAKACELALNASVDSDRALKLTDAAIELFIRIQTVADELTGKLEADPPNDEAATLAQQVSSQLERVRSFHRGVRELQQCAALVPTESDGEASEPVD